MANAYSTVRGVQQYIEPYDMALMGKTMGAMQDRYNQNYEAVQGLLDQYSSLDVIRDVDKGYLNEKLTALTEGINQYGAQDLTSNAVAGSMSKHIKQVLDDNVMSAVTSTQRIRNLQNTIEEVKTKKPELYSAENERFAMRGVQEYASSTELGKEYGGGSYVNYYDYQKELDDRLGNLEKYADTVDRTWREGGYIYSQNGKVMSEDEVRSIAEGTLSSKARTQMQIEGWSNYGGDDATATAEAFKAHTTSQMAQYKHELDKHEVELAANPNNKNAKANVEAYRARNKSFEDMSKNWLAKPEEFMSSMQYTMQHDKVMDSAAKLYSFSQLKTTQSADDIYVQQMKQDFELYKLQLEEEAKPEGLIPVAQPTEGIYGLDRHTEDIFTSKQTKKGFEQGIDLMFQDFKDENKKKKITQNPEWLKKDGSFNYEKFYVNVIKDSDKEKGAFRHKEHLAKLYSEYKYDSDYLNTHTKQAKTVYEESELLPKLYNKAIEDGVVLGFKDGKAVTAKDLGGEDTDSVGSILWAGIKDLALATSIPTMGVAGVHSRAESTKERQASNTFLKSPENKNMLLSRYYAEVAVNGKSDGEKRYGEARLKELTNNDGDIMSKYKNLVVESSKDSGSSTPLERSYYTTTYKGDYRGNTFSGMVGDNPIGNSAAVKKIYNEVISRTENDRPQNYSFDVLPDTPEYEALLSTNPRGMNLPKSGTDLARIVTNPVNGTFVVESEIQKADGTVILQRSLPMQLKGTALEQYINIDNKKRRFDAMVATGQTDIGNSTLLPSTSNYIQKMGKAGSGVEGYVHYASEGLLTEHLKNNFPDKYKANPKVEAVTNYLMNSPKLDVRLIPDKGSSGEFGNDGSWNRAIVDKNSGEVIVANVLQDGNGNNMRYLDENNQNIMYQYPQMQRGMLIESIFGGTQSEFLKSIDRLYEELNLERS